MKKNKRILLGGTCILTVFLLVVGGYIFVRYNNYVKDFSRLRSETYDTVFFSMYPIENYDEADYTYVRGMDVIKNSEVISDAQVMKTYMDIAVGSENLITTAYLGVDPVKADTKEITQIVLENPGIMFEMILGYPKIDYWLAMDDDKCREIWEGYREFAGDVLGLGNVRVYYYCNEEWLICNPGNYVDTFETNVEVSKVLMCNSDYLHDNILNAENFHGRFNEAWTLIEKYRTESAEYPDASDLEIIFFGDSVIGNYTDSMSVPGVVSGLTNAMVYNCGYGGKSAALSHKTLESVAQIVEAFIQQDLSKVPMETQVYAGIEQYIREGKPDKDKIFVINYGLNDYFDGVPVKSEDPYDVASYSGAMRAAVEALLKAYPKADILLMTPNLSIEFNAGEEIRTEMGGRLQDYADAVIALADELGVNVLDNFRELPITKENHWKLLSDGTHPNEQGRFLIGMRIAEIVK